MLVLVVVLVDVSGGGGGGGCSGGGGGGILPSTESQTSIIPSISLAPFPQHLSGSMHMSPVSISLQGNLELSTKRIC